MKTSHGSPSKIARCSTSRVTPSEFEALEQTNLSPEDIAASLNETESGRLRSLGMWHGNTKRAYPFWKTCTVCLIVFPTEDRAAAARSKTCGQECKVTLFQRTYKPTRVGQTMVEATCAECGVTFMRQPAWLKKTASPKCSRACNGAERARHMVQHENHALGSTTPEAIAKRTAKMMGAYNPAWKGGVTKINRRGNYQKHEILTRCPPEFASMRRANGYVLEHRLVVAIAIGRPLTRQEAVHHIDHNPSNNDPSNLMLFASNKDHKTFEGRGLPLPMWSGLSESDTSARSGV